MTDTLTDRPVEDEPPAYLRQPAKLIRLASVARAMLTEARSTPCDAAGCEQCRSIYEGTVAALESVLCDDLRVELAVLTMVFEEPPLPHRNCG